MMLFQIPYLRVSLAAEVALAGLEAVVLAKMVFEVAALVKALVAAIHFADKRQHIFLGVSIVYF